MVSASAAERPNVLFFFVDDLGKYASIYQEEGNPSLNDFIETPAFDRIGREGVVFDNAFVPVASCGPCRSSLATGRYFWNCGSGAFLNGKASDWKGQSNPFHVLPKWPDLLAKGGYRVFKSQKTFSFTPSRQSAPMRAMKKLPYQRYGLYVGTAENETMRKARHDETLAHPRQEMKRVLADDADAPFFFVYGSINVHRPYTPDSGKKLWSIEPDDLKGLLPKFLPDVKVVRRDFSDYLGEVMAADAMLGVMLEELEAAGELDNTVVIVSGDHGIPGVPRGKTNCYDLATRVPLLVRWPESIKKGRRVNDFVSVMDVGPTVLDLAGVKVPGEMDGLSFLKQLQSKENGWVDKKRSEVVIGRELHVHSSRPGDLPYPMRAIRNGKYLYIKNFKPERWPMGNPYDAADLDSEGELYQMGLSTVPAYRDLDGSLTKAFMMSKRDTTGKALFDLTMSRRPSEELYLVGEDPDQLKNLAGDSEHADVLKRLRNRLVKIQKK
ncbi:sulfatase, partial [bacterium]|nr:sulfatase [bacterium]